MSDFDTWWNAQVDWSEVTPESIWNAAIAHIKQNYTLCEKKPVVVAPFRDSPIPLYVEVKK